MENYEKLYNEILEQEEELRFKSFNNEDALKLGLLYVEKAKKEDKKISIDIRVNGYQLFYYGFEGTSLDNTHWVKRKSNIVNRFHMSSYRMGILLKKEKTTLEDKFFISSMENSAFGGSFPITIIGTGVIGTITISGLAEEEDHKMLVEGLKEYLKN